MDFSNLLLHFSFFFFLLLLQICTVLFSDFFLSIKSSLSFSHYSLFTFKFDASNWWLKFLLSVNQQVTHRGRKGGGERERERPFNSMCSPHREILAFVFPVLIHEALIMPSKRKEHSQTHFFGWIWLLSEESYVYVTKISSYFLFHC